MRTIYSSALFKSVLIICTFIFISVSCSLKDEPSCSGGEIWQVTTKVESMTYQVGVLKAIDSDSTFHFDGDTTAEGDKTILLLVQSSEINNAGTTSQRSTFSFFQSAYASPGPIFASVDTIKNISIKAPVEFNSIQAGDELSALFKVIPERPYQKYNISEAIKNQKDIPFLTGAPTARIILTIDKGIFPEEFNLEMTLESGEKLNLNIVPSRMN
ncbi:hypothetical protein [Flammeovirga aprica]|uniref:Uncharacterized protein n=1 Tax=Flammeovirga aprica JL-4 TaxID=694437 RepID=A0A7X9RWD3_9BACT|nr:hypothetical protein [Flammeovirga aprica]NME69889.1 hypothetical protein [Flammeovirga aprica JL-4]